MTHKGMDKDGNIVPMKDLDRGEMSSQVNTCEKGVTVNLSFSDSLAGSKGFDRLLVQLGKEGEYATAYLTEKQTEDLYQAVCNARNHWKYGQ